MSNLIRWEPVREIVSLREAMDRLFDDSFTQPLGLRDGWQNLAVDMYETADDVIVKAAAPGIKAEEVQISVTGDLLTIQGEAREKNEVQEKSYQLREQRWGAFERRLLLPTAVVSDKAKAEFEDGILTVTLPKAEQVKSKLIPVKAK